MRNETVCRHYLKQLLPVVDYIHSRGISHRDLKLENILVDSEANLRVIDFGLAITLKELEDPSKPKSNVGTIYYKPPEVEQMREIQDGTKIYVFALGVILYTIYFLNFPFPGGAHSQEQYYQHIFNGNANHFWHLQRIRYKVQTIPEGLVDLITRMISPHPE